MDPMIALDDAIEDVIRCACAVEESKGSTSDERLERLRTIGVVHRILRKRAREQEQACACEECDVKKAKEVIVSE